MINLEELKKLAKAATPGPWDGIISSYCLLHNGGREEVPFNYDNRLFMAAANPETVLRLIDNFEKAVRALKIIMNAETQDQVEDSGYIAEDVLKELGEFDE